MKEKEKKTAMNQNQKLSELDKFLISLGLQPAEKNKKTGYSIIFSNRLIVKKKTKKKKSK